MKKEKRIMTREEKRFFFVLSVISAIVVIGICLYGYIKAPDLMLMLAVFWH